MSRKKRDPLINALVSKLPNEGDKFSASQQEAWLNLMAMALQTAYGYEDTATEPSAPTPVKRKPGRPRKAQAQKVDHKFYIDGSGFVRGKDGQLINADQVTGELFDTRGEDGDLREIQWADGTKGLNGADLTIISA
jgi:hypothetical protein